MFKKNFLVFLLSAILALVIGFLLANVAKMGLPASVGIGLVIFLLPLIWGKPESGLSLIAFFLPFERIPTADIGGMSIKINHILIMMVLVTYILQKLAEKKLVIPRDPIRYLVALFITSLTFSLSQAVNFQRGLQVLIFVIFMAVFYFAITLIVTNKKTLIYILYGLFAGAFFQVALGFFQFAGDAAGLPITVTLLKPGYDKITFGFARVQGTAMEPLYYANYIFIPLFVTIILLLRGQAEVIINKVWAYVLAGFLLLCFILAVSRGAYIGLVAAGLVMLVSQAKLIFRAKTVLTTVLLVLLVGVGSYLGLVKSEPRALEEFIGHAMVNDAEIGESVVSRVNATEQALELFKQKPLIGNGLGNFGPIVQGNPASQPDGGWHIVNNEYVELLAENGAIGLLMFLILVLAVLYRATKAIQREKDEFIKSVLIGLTLAFVAILAQYLTFSTIYIIHIWMLIGLISSITYFSLSKNEKNA